MERELEIFGELLDLPPTGRAAILERAGREDPGLRARLEALLEGYESAGSFLEALPGARPAPLPDEKPGDVIGRYTLLKKIGEGGCGTVYLAEQKIPVRRRVALKVIKLGMDTRSVIARFEGERQALALMDHPDIARVLDAGATDAGRPFFVMDFVDGVPIAKFCDERSLPLRARLELFARVCLALQHAHQKGIIHRDVKPSNILVTEVDGVPTPKVIDFGIAKATQERLTEHTLLTGVDQFIGTPSYMSPEQADLRDLDIDTRSDIYALGVVLYELLAGRLPFDPRSFQHAGVEEIRRIIRESEPPRPSARIAALPPAERATVAHLRATAPAGLAAALRGDLDWIAMRCLEKDRARRYSSAQELADDVRRHLRSEPVEARPPSTLYRTQRFVARHRLACASAAAIVVSLIIGTVVSVRQAWRATVAERTASAERDAANLARADAQRRQDRAEDVLAFMLGDFRDDLKKIGQLPLLEKVGNKAQAYFDATDPRDLTDIALTRQAKALSQIGEVRLLQKHVRYDEAEKVFFAAYQRASELAARHPRDGNMLFERAQAEYWIGHTSRRRGNLAETAKWYARYRDSAAALVALDPANVTWQRELISGHHNLAGLDLQCDRLDKARGGFLAESEAVRRLLAATPKDQKLLYKLAVIDSFLGEIAIHEGEYTEALRRFASERSLLESLLRDEPASPQFMLKLVECLTWESGVLATTGSRSGAGERLARGRQMLAPLLERDASNRRWREALETIQMREVELAAAEDTVEAARMVAEMRKRSEVSLAADPADPGASLRLMVILRLEARLRLENGQAGAMGLAARALEIAEVLVKEGRVTGQSVFSTANCYIVAGRIAAAEGRADEAAGFWRRGYDLLAPRTAGSRNRWVLDPAARALSWLGRTAESAAMIELLGQLGYVPLEPWPAPGALSRP